MRTAPGLICVSSGVCRGRMPSSPTTPGSTTNSAGPEKICSSALTTSTWMVLAMAVSAGSLRRLPARPTVHAYCSVFAFSNASSIVPTM